MKRGVNYAVLVLLLVGVMFGAFFAVNTEVLLSPGEIGSGAEISEKDFPCVDDSRNSCDSDQEGDVICSELFPSKICKCLCAENGKCSWKHIMCGGGEVCRAGENGGCFPR